jgi:hypothetical protein
MMEGYSIVLMMGGFISDANRDRAWTTNKAEGLSLTGFVRNSKDGTVSKRRPAVASVRCGQSFIIPNNISVSVMTGDWRGPRQ